MIKVGVRVDNIAGFDAQFEEVVKAIEANVEQTAAVVESEARITSQFSDKTGQLRRSVGKRKSRKSDGAYLVFAKAPHAHLVEYGHVMIAWGNPTGKRVAPRPFMRRALEKGIATAVQLFRVKK